MAQKKAHEVDSFVRQPDKSYRAFLIYGPDRGLVSERAAILSRSFDIDLKDAFSVIKLDGQDIKDDPARLLDEINAIGLFGGDRLVWLRNAGNDRTVATAIDAISADPPETTILLIEGGDLKKGSALRKSAESGSSAIALPCYGDDGRNLQALIDEELGQAGLQITSAARQVLADHLGGDRLASRGELQKLCLYCKGKDRIEEADIFAVIGDASALSVDQAVDSILAGDVSGLDQALQRIIASKTQIFVVLQACLRQFQAINLVRGRIEGGREPAAQVIAEFGRRMHFKRKPVFEKAARHWNEKSSSQALQHLSSAILEGRKSPALQESIARQALLAIAVRAARLAR